MTSFVTRLLSTGSLMAAASIAYAGDEFMSLASFASMDTDEIQTLHTRVFPEGLFGVQVTTVNLAQQQKEGIDPATGMPYAPLFPLGFKYLVLEAKPVDDKLDPETLKNRNINHSITIWPKSQKEDIGIIKGMYERAGIENIGKLGGIEGAEPGWLDNAKEAQIWIRVKHGKVQADGSQRVYIDWLKEEDAAKLLEAMSS